MRKTLFFFLYLIFLYNFDIALAQGRVVLIEEDENIDSQQQLPLIIPQPALPSPLSLFLKIPSPINRELPQFLNLLPRKKIVVLRDNRIAQIRDVRTIALHSPISFFRARLNEIVLLTTLRGLNMAQILNMSVFCINKVVYSGPFAHQIIFKLEGGYPNGTECLVAIEFEEKKDSGDIKTLEDRFVLPKSL